MPPYNIMSTAAPRGEEEERSFTLQVDKAPRLGNSIVIWIMSSDTDTICQLNQFNANSEAAMLSSAQQKHLKKLYKLSQNAKVIVSFG